MKFKWRIIRGMWCKPVSRVTDTFGNVTWVLALPWVVVLVISRGTRRDYTDGLWMSEFQDGTHWYVKTYNRSGDKVEAAIPISKIEGDVPHIWTDREVYRLGRLFAYILNDNPYDSTRCDKRDAFRLLGKF